VSALTADAADASSATAMSPLGKSRMTPRISADRGRPEVTDARSNWRLDPFFQTPADATAMSAFLPLSTT